MQKKILSLAFAVITSTLLLSPLAQAQTQRQAEVAQRGAGVMPFSLQATQHIFTPDVDGGTQQVRVKDPLDTEQIQLVRQHLQEIQGQFLKGDFSGPSQIHGSTMPGLAQLKNAKLGDVNLAYRELPDGAQITYRSKQPILVLALHDWFNAQLSDHGSDAMAGHSMHNSDAMAGHRMHGGTMPKQ
jgi:hypothetical protein